MAQKTGQAAVDVVADFSRFAAQFQKDLNSALKGVKVDTSRVSSGLSAGVAEGASKASESIGKFGAEADKTFSGVAKKSTATGQTMSAAFTKAGKDMADAGDKMSMALTLPVAAAGVATMNAAGNFEQAMNKVKAATESSGKEFENLRKLAIDLGSTTAFSASEAAYAMNELATAGFDTTEIMGAIPGVLDMAAAGSVSLASAAEIAAGILNGFGFAATDLGAVNDILTKTFLATATNLTDLGESFKYVGPTAKSAGLSFTETAAAIGLMGNAGIRGSMAGTALNASISRLLKPTAEVARTLKKLGVTVTSSSGKLLPLVQIIKQLEKAGASTADMITLFGLEAGPDMQALLSQGSGALAELDAQLQKAGGTAARVAKTQLEGFNGSMDELSSAAEGLMIAIGDAGLLGWMTSLTEALTSLVSRLSQAPPSFVKIATIVSIVIAAIGPFLAITGRMVAAIGEGIIAFKKFGTWALKVAPWLSALTGPVGWVIAGLVALGVAAVIAYKKSDTFRRIVDTAFRAIATAAVWMWKQAVAAFNAIAEGVRRLIANAGALYRQAAPVFQAIGKVVMDLWSSQIRPALSSLGNAFAHAGQAVADFWSRSVRPALSATMGFFDRLAKAVSSWWKGNGDKVMSAAASIVKWFGGIISTVLSAVITVFRDVGRVAVWLFKQIIVPVFQGIAAVVKTLIAVVIKLRPIWIILGAVIGAALGVAIVIIKALWVVVSTVFSAIGKIVQWLYTSIIRPVFSAIGSIIKVVIGVFSWLWSVVQPIVMAIATVLGALGTAIIWLWNAASTAVSAIGAAFSWLWSTILQPTFSLFAQGLRAIISVVMWMWNTFSPIFAAIGNLVWSVWSGILSVVFSLLKLAFAAVVAVVKVFHGIVVQVFNAVGSVISAVWRSFIKPVIDAFGAAFTWLWQNVIQPTANAIGSVFSWLWNVVRTAVNAIGSIFSWLWSVISPVVNSIANGFRWLWSQVTSIFNAIVSAIRTGASNISATAGSIASFINSIGDHFNRGVAIVRDRIGAMVSVVRDLPGRIMSGIGSLGSLLYGAGQNLINGLINGITSRVGALLSRVSGVAGEIRDRFPFSPAKTGPLSGHGDLLFAGQETIARLASGIDAALPDLQFVTTKAASTISDPLSEQRLSIPDLAPLPAALAALPSRDDRGNSSSVAYYTINVASLDPRTAAPLVMDAINEYERRNGRAWRK